MEIRYVDDGAGMEAVASALATADRIALDCEAAGYHRYSDRLCLLQIAAGSATFLVDTLAVNPASDLRQALEDPTVEVVMHGADFDIRLMHRDLGIGLAGLFDTQIAASLVGAKAIGLSALLQDRLGIHLSKKFQKADWAERPLSSGMREYAAEDTAHLLTLRSKLLRELEEKGRVAWAEEEFRELEKARFEEEPNQDPVTRLRAARDLEPREVARLREALAWRDGIAQEQDRALFRVAGDAVLLQIARESPGNVRELEQIPGMSERLARRSGEELLERLRKVDRAPDGEMRGYPRIPRGNGSGRRLGPEVEVRLGRLKAVRNARAAELGLDKGTLLPNSVLQLLAETPPSSIEDIGRVPGIRRWQAGLLAQDLLDAP
ncbi:MAG: ribonuclease D [Gemmatimonadetes bacterium]|nr:ribonuclease D [Gemmatimonadota bacterium]